MPASSMAVLSVTSRRLSLDFDVPSDSSSHHQTSSSTSVSPKLRRVSSSFSDTEVHIVPSPEPTPVSVLIRKRASVAGPVSGELVPLQVIEPAELASRLANPDSPAQPLILLDLRPPACYARCHINGALLTNCSSRMKTRRAVRIVTDLLSSSSNDLSGCNPMVVVYTDTGSVLKLDDPVVGLIRHLEALKVSVCTVSGGLREFRLLYPDLCGTGSMRPQIVTEGLTAICCPDSADIYQTKPTEILPFLYLGNELDALDESFLSEHKLDYILNLTRASPFLDESRFQCLRLPATDVHTQDLRQHFHAAFRFIESARTAGGRVLVHCQAGVSRSATIVIAYLLAHAGGRLDLSTVQRWVKKRRSIISPNFSFLGQLVQFEEDLRSGREARPDTLDLVVDWNCCSSPVEDGDEISRDLLVAASCC